MVKKKSEWFCWGVSVQGPAHKKYGIPNQDAFLARRFCWGEVLSVSDGMGSKSKSHIGSNAACRAVAEASREFAVSGATDINSLPERIHTIWKLLIAPYRAEQCSATCLFVIRHCGRVILAQLGDGLIAGCRKDGSVLLITDDKEDSFSNITTGLAEMYIAGDWRVTTSSENEFDAFLLFTDGISEDIQTEKRAAFAQKLYSVYRDKKNSVRLKEINKMLTNWSVPGHSDDKTMACLFRRGKI